MSPLGVVPIPQVATLEALRLETNRNLLALSVAIANLGTGAYNKQVNGPNGTTGSTPITPGGSLVIPDHSITANKLVDFTLTEQQLADNAIQRRNILDGAISDLKIAANAVTEAKIAANAVSGTKIVAGAVQTLHMAANSIDADRLVSRSIVADKLVALSITSSELATDSITTDKITSRAITALKIASDTITANEMAAVISWAKQFVVATNGNIRGGQTAYNTGNGFWLGWDSTAYKFSIGNSAKYLTWDGSNFRITSDYFELGDVTAKFILDLDPTFVGPNPPARVRFGNGKWSANASGDTSLLVQTCNINGADGLLTPTLIVAGGRSAGKAGHIVFTNSYWSSANNFPAPGAASIMAIDSGSSGGELIFSTTSNGGGVNGTPAERVRITQDGYFQYGTYVATPSSVVGYITIKDSTGTNRKLAVLS
jgi:hypothetical protein